MKELQWEHIEYLWALGLIPVMWAVHMTHGWWQKRLIRKIGEPRLQPVYLPGKARQKRAFKFLLLVLAWTGVVLALANPRAGLGSRKVKLRGADVMIALDVSRSMLAEDIRPNRLERARLFCSRLIDRLPNDRIGLIVFAGHAYLQMPLTTDHDAARLFLENAIPDLVPTQGTAIAEAIRLAMESFPEGNDMYRALILISDGEDHEAGCLEAAREAAGKGIMIEAIGIGSARGAPIPVYQNGILKGYKKGPDGEVVLTKLNEETLQQVALAANGHYQPFDGSNAQIRTVRQHLEALEKAEIDTVQFKDWVSYYRVPLGLAVFLLIIELLISNQRTEAFVNWKIFRA